MSLPNLLEQITPVILTYNEAPNLARTLDALTWATRVVVVDSDSTDATESIARSYPNVDFRQHPYRSHADKCNHALEQLVSDCPWVLFLDADYIVTPVLREEMAALQPAPEVSGYWIPFRYCIDGHPLRGTLYPPRICLFRPTSGHFGQYGHTQLLELTGDVLRLQGRILHDDRKLSANFSARQRRYAELEAAYLLSQPFATLDWRKRLRRLLLIAPWAAPVFVLFGKGVILDGVPGLKYAWERTQAECLIAMALAKQSFSSRKKFSG